MTFASALAAAQWRPGDEEVLAGLADEALVYGEEERALPLLDRGAAAGGSARLWQWKGLLERGLDEHEHALESFRQAAQLAPADASIAHGHARVALEAGLPEAEPLFERACRLAPADGAVLMGLTAARLAAGHGAQAEAELEILLTQAPAWIEGHMQLSQLRSMLGRPKQASASLDAALGARPGDPTLWQALFDLHVKRADFVSLDEALEHARAASIGAGLLLPYQAIAAAELGQVGRADTLFGHLGERAATLAVWRVRHLIRSGRPLEALPLIDAELAGAGAADAWPYAAAAWRLIGDPRSAWLERDAELVSVTNLEDRLPPLRELADELRSLHVAKGEHLDQSVRGGTQTDGPLFSRIDPAIRAMRRAIVAAVEKYVAQLPPPDPRHPLLRHRRDRKIRFAGSWSVRLRSGGRHSNHVHPQGWISSALYISLPRGAPGDAEDSGWLTLGQPDDLLGIDLPPWRTVEPKPGQLVLFPSWMWHGTVPFTAGERLTVAFDVSVPR